MASKRRYLVYARDDTFIKELNPDLMLSSTMYEELNGEHTLDITTSETINKGDRIRMRMTRQNGYTYGAVEFAVAGVSAVHTEGKHALYSYHCVWSIQEDLMGVPVSVMPGIKTTGGANAFGALVSILSTQERWEAVNLSPTSMKRGKASMYDMSAWEAIGVLAKTWGVEVDVYLVWRSASDPLQRRVIVQDHLGRSGAQHRFDFGEDMRGITRIIADEPPYCGISPRGKGEQVGDGYGRKITIESVNGGRDYIMNNAAVSETSLFDEYSGTYLDPIRIVENSACETPAELKAWAQENLASLTAPSVTYEIDTVDAAIGNIGSIYLGDDVDIVDSSFYPGSDYGLRLTGRIMSITRDLLNDKDIRVTISSERESIASQFRSTNSKISTVESRVLSYGEQLSDSTSGVSVATGTNTNVLSLTLGIGVWLVNGRVGFPVNATGRRAAKISKTSQDTANVISTVTQDAVNGALTHCSTMRCIYITGAEVAAGTNKVYLIGYQTSGESLSANGAIEATRIG